jgi:hypothetical protein
MSPSPQRETHANANAMLSEQLCKIADSRQVRRLRTMFVQLTNNCKSIGASEAEASEAGGAWGECQQSGPGHIPTNNVLNNIQHSQAHKLHVSCDCCAPAISKQSEHTETQLNVSVSQVTP